MWKAAILMAISMTVAGPQFVAAQEHAEPGPPSGPRPVESPELLDALRVALPHLSASELTELMQTGVLKRVTDTTLGKDYSTEALVAAWAPAFASEISDAIATLAPTIQVEVLLLQPSPLTPNTITPEAYTSLQAMSSMAGIEYYSASRERMRILFHESWVVGSPQSRDPIPDPISQSIPSTETLYAFQHDSSFGRNVLQATYAWDGTAVMVSMTNLTRMLYRGVVPAVAPEKLQLHLVIMPLDDHLLFYGTSASIPATLLGMEDRVGRSFSNRLIALHNWYMGQIADIR